MPVAGSSFESLTKLEKSHLCSGFKNDGKVDGEGEDHALEGLAAKLRQGGPQAAAGANSNINHNHNHRPQLKDYNLVVDKP